MPEPRIPLDQWRALVAVVEKGGYAKAAAALHKSQSDRKSTRLNSSHGYISYAVFCLKKKKRIDAAVLIFPYMRTADTGGVVVMATLHAEVERYGLHAAIVHVTGTEQAQIIYVVCAD